MTKRAVSHLRPEGSSPLPPLLEEILQQRGRLALADSTINLGAVVAGRLREDARPVLDPAAFRIVGAEIDPAHPEQSDRRGAHRARLERDMEIVIGEELRPARRRPRT